ncbi:MAG TPA: WGR domain-containing protein [Acidobacteriota bacterium]|nr:WGR domain-containing protein [Acidobacteriota bacterium]
MKLIKQTLLSFREGSSDKVYEVDLCEVSQNRYVVNYRYGRRGTTLKEGTQTVSPVSLADGERIFADLVKSKTKKGYREGASPEPAATEPAAKPTTPLGPPNQEARNQQILHLLAHPELAQRKPVTTGVLGAVRSVLTGKRQPAKKGWPLERVIWRAGELKLRDAAPLLIRLIGTGDALRDYCIAWALGWCGDEKTVSTLGRIYGDAATPEHVRRIACEALIKLSDPETRAEFQSDMVDRLPSPLKETARTGKSEEFTSALRGYLESGGPSHYSVLDTIYLIDSQTVRPALLGLLKSAPLRPNYFRAFRHIFKAAEYRRDAEVFGILAYRFEKEKPMFRKLGSYSSYYIDDSSQTHSTEDVKKTLKSASSKLAYSQNTRNFLRIRVWRTLRRLGELGDHDFVKMAVGVLLPYSDADAHPTRTSTRYVARPTTNQRGRHSVDYVAVTNHWDTFAPYFAFNAILYHHSPRYIRPKGSMVWRCKPNARPGQPVPTVREEAFPKLWEAMPVGLLHLLSESNCLPVHQFAVRALRACTEFCGQLPVDAVVMLLNRPYEITAQFGFELANVRYTPEVPDFELVLAVASCAYGAARQQAHQWITTSRDRFVKDSGFLAGLASSLYADTRVFARTLLRSVSFTEDAARACIVKLIAHLLVLEPHQAEQAKDIAETVFTVFSAQLRTIGLNVVADLVTHPMVEVQELGGNILLNHETKAHNLPESLIHALIQSNFETIRAIGIRLLSELPDELLVNRKGVLRAICIHALPDLRQAIRPLIRRLGAAETHPDFILGFSTLLLESLLKPQPNDGVYSHLVLVLKEDLNPMWGRQVSKELVWRLIKSRASAAQDVGGYLLKLNVAWAEELTTDDITRLCNHEMLSVREAVQVLFQAIVPRLRGNHEEMGKAIRLLDSKWPDLRQFGVKILREEFSESDFNPQILVSLCDSIRPDIQQFGREMITRYFTEADGQEYLLKLSEHPSATLQMFATNYLEGYAAGNVERLEQLTLYFVTVLSHVNKARVAKTRILQFLEAEAIKSEAAAQLVAEVMSRQSVTMAIGDKASTIEIMVRLHQKYPSIPLPMAVKPTEVRYAV